jgi:hypothetical protein
MAGMEKFTTGAQRDQLGDKVRFELLPVYPLKVVAKRMTSGAIHYGEDNWRKGMPFRRTFGSLLRHAFAWYHQAEGDYEDDEDHLAGVIFNAMCLIQYQKDMKDGNLSEDLDDRPRPSDEVLDSSCSPY